MRSSALTSSLVSLYTSYFEISNNKSFSCYWSISRLIIDAYAQLFKLIKIEEFIKKIEVENATETLIFLIAEFFVTIFCFLMIGEISKFVFFSLSRLD